MLKNLIIMLLVGLTLSNLFATKLTHYNSMFQPQEVKDDIDQWLTFVEKTHQDLAYTTKDVALFYKEINHFKSSINQPISVRNFWLEMMQFNSLISDGHFSLAPNKKEELNGESAKLVGNVIKKINGIAINIVLEPLLQRTHGDSDAQRKAILATRFSIYYWLYFGEQSSLSWT